MLFVCLSLYTKGYFCINSHTFLVQYIFDVYSRVLKDFPSLIKSFNILLNVKKKVKTYWWAKECRQKGSKSNNNQLINVMMWEGSYCQKFWCMYLITEIKGRKTIFRIRNLNIPYFLKKLKQVSLRNIFRCMEERM